MKGETTPISDDQQDWVVERSVYRAVWTAEIETCPTCHSQIELQTKHYYVVLKGTESNRDSAEPERKEYVFCTLDCANRLLNQ